MFDITQYNTEILFDIRQHNTETLFDSIQHNTETLFDITQHTCTTETLFDIIQYDTETISNNMILIHCSISDYTIMIHLILRLLNVLKLFQVLGLHLRYTLKH